MIMSNTFLTISFFEVALRDHARHPRAPPHQRGDERCCRQEGQGVGQDIKGIFAGPKPEKVNKRGEIFLPCRSGAQMWRQAFRGEGRGVDSSAWLRGLNRTPTCVPPDYGPEG